MRSMRRCLALAVCLVLLVCVAGAGAMAHGDESKQDVVQDVPEDQLIVFEDMMEYMGIDPPYYIYSFQIKLHSPRVWNPSKEVCVPSQELVDAFPNYKAMRFMNNSDKKYYVAYDCTDGSTVFFFIDKYMIVKVIRVQPRCTPEAFEQVQIGMYFEDVFAIDPNTDLVLEGASFPPESWHWLSDDTFVRIEYKPTDSGYKIAAIEYFSNFEEILEHGVGGSNFRYLNPADMPE